MWNLVLGIRAKRSKIRAEWRKRESEPNASFSVAKLYYMIGYKLKVETTVRSGVSDRDDKNGWQNDPITAPNLA